MGGNIIFHKDVGVDSAISTVTDIEGVFVADKKIKIEGNTDAGIKDYKFIGEGTFVGWEGFVLTRDYGNTNYMWDRALNNENPIEVFKFRPDFNKNTPEIMKRPSLTWQEVN